MGWRWLTLVLKKQRMVKNEKHIAARRVINPCQAGAIPNSKVSGIARRTLFCRKQPG